MSIAPVDFDYDNFDPTVPSINYPPNGDYVFAVMGIEDKFFKAGHRIIEIHLEVASGEHSKSKVIMGYYVGNPNIEQAGWAKEALGRIYFGITGVRLTNNSFPTIEKDLQFKPFNATFEATTKDGKTYPKLKNITPGIVAATNISTSSAQAPWSVA